MKKNTWPIYIVTLIVLIILATACGAGSEPVATPSPVVITVVVTAEPESVAVVIEEGATSAETDVPTTTLLPAATAIPEDSAAATAEPSATATSVPPATAEATTEAVIETAEADATPMTMSLNSLRARTEYSKRPDDFVAPTSVTDIVAPPEDSWSVLDPDETTVFQTYDGVRVTGEGEAWLDLGDLMHLILKRDSVAQFVPGDLPAGKLADIKVEIADTPLLQRIVLAIHINRGGFLGEKLRSSDAIALTTPNAVVIVSGTNFFIVYDPDADSTLVGNFDGTIDVADVEEEDDDSLPARNLIAIPPVRGRKLWPIHDHVTPEEFERLIDLLESPIAAADMISGPYLVVELDPQVDVHSGPGTEFAVVGNLTNSDYARVIGRGGEWWQIECPRNVQSGNAGCWVSGGDSFESVFNVDDLPELAVCEVINSTVVRQGPGTTCDILRSAPPGLILPIEGRNARGDWYQVITPNGRTGWIGSSGCAPITVNVDLVSNIPATCAAQVQPTETPSGADSEIKDVWHCSYIGNKKFEWYSYEVFYDTAGNPVREEQIAGPFSGPWTSGCPTGPRMWVEGCTVHWDVEGSVTEAYFSYKEYEDYGALALQFAEVSASVPVGSHLFHQSANSIGDTDFFLRIVFSDGHSETVKLKHNFPQHSCS